MRTFYEAIISDGSMHRVFGRKLRPLCASHCLALSAIDSPLMTNDTNRAIYPHDLMVAAAICSSENPTEFALNKSFKEALLVGYACSNQKYFESQIKKWVAYQADYFSVPDVYQNSANKGNLASYCPWIGRLAVYAVSEMNIPEKRAWSMPIGMLIWYQAIHQEISGGLRIADLEAIEDEEKNKPTDTEDEIESIRNKLIERGVLRA